ncbi:hypothetical protein MTBBW1_1670076 [Desulfamplus magnetovallimortis]|uniref:Uncharacterized protein n=1 Tax=Desulfamplus magnetovallimortis TaxID=1246637 RepID=A0A1W1H994_9BACT|nr:hypothetical protein MTBBW1_1670076 [Desulfamplus magnetovallimortis]
MVWGFLEVMDIFSPVTRFRSVDLPAFGAPAMAIKPDLKIAGKTAPTLFPLWASLFTEGGSEVVFDTKSPVSSVYMKVSINSCF